jgi:hypothetical protein
MSARAGGALRAGALVLLAAAAFAAPARARHVAVVVVPSIDPIEAEEDGAVGLLVPGAGSTVTRAGALSSLLRGKTVTSLLGGKASGNALIRLSNENEPASLTIYVVLPPPGRTHNTHRYPIAIVGGGYRPGSLLQSSTTRVPGLISIADVAPTAVDLARGHTPVITSRELATPVTRLADLDRRLRRAHDARTDATMILVFSTLFLAGISLVGRSRLLARAGLLAIPAALATSLALSVAGVSRPGTVTAVLAVATVGGALAAAIRRQWLSPLLVLFLVAFLAALVAWPDLNALSVIGPHPDGGGRFYGVTNEVETLLLVPVLASAALAPRALLLPLGALALVLVGWSRAGADGGGIIVVLVALAAFWCVRERVRVTPVRVAAALIAVVAVALVLVGIDALTGGSSHVTHAVGGGPGSLAGDLAHRLRVSYKGVLATTQSRITFGANLFALAVVALRRPRLAVTDALLVALLASLLVNDTPTDVIAYGALSAAALGAWAIVDVEWVTERSALGARPRVWRAPRRR